MPSRAFALEGRARADGTLDQALTNTVSPGYFETMGIPIANGVDFANLRDPAAAPQAIVNDAFVQRYAAGGHVLGRWIETSGRQYTVVGIVRDSLYDAYGEPPTPFIYLSLRDRPSPLAEIHARTRPGSETAIAADLRAIVRELDQRLPLYNVRTLDSHVDANLVFQRIPARMFAVLGPLLLMLVSVGIYAVVAYSVSQRRKEIGTRLALGATAGRVVKTLVRDTLRVVALGMAGGGVVAFLIDPDLLHGRQSELPLLLGVAALFLASVTLASWLPARRASRVDPVAALRHD
jgi:hypothetical protein